MSILPAGLTGHLSLREVTDLTEEVLNSLPEEKAPRPELHSPDQVDGDVAEVAFFPNPVVKAAKASPNREVLPIQKEDDREEETSKEEESDEKHARHAAQHYDNAPSVSEVGLSKIAPMEEPPSPLIVQPVSQDLLDRALGPLSSPPQTIPASPEEGRVPTSQQAEKSVEKPPSTQPQDMPTWLRNEISGYVTAPLPRPSPQHVSPPMARGGPQPVRQVVSRRTVVVGLAGAE